MTFELQRSAWPITLFRIDPSRSSQVLVDMLGEEFRGVLGCDYFSAYRKYMGDFNVLVQFCLAHLLCDIRFLVEHPNPRNRAYGRRLLEATRHVFHVIHQGRKYSAAAFQRFEQHGESYLRFITTPGIEPTNNLAEQAIRFVVIDRHVTQGSRSEAGRRWLERIWSTMATCAQQGRSTFEFLVQSVRAHFRGQQPPRCCPTPHSRHAWSAPTPSHCLRSRL